MLSYILYILERLSSWSILQIRLSWPHPQARLDLFFFFQDFFHIYLLVCLGPPSIWLFIPTIRVSHVHPSLTTRQLNTSTQVNNLTMLHLIYNGHTYIHHINVTIFISFILPLHFWAGRLAPIPLIGNRKKRSAATAV
jgi:hypothetical protein